MLLTQLNKTLIINHYVPKLFIDKNDISNLLSRLEHIFVPLIFLAVGSLVSVIVFALEMTTCNGDKTTSKAEDKMTTWTGDKTTNNNAGDPGIQE